MNEPNPYEPPRAALSAGTDASASLQLSQREVGAFVGPNAGYYREKWPLAGDRVGRSASFNWAAFFVPELWLAYRKMYVAASIVWGSLLIGATAEQVVFVKAIAKPRTLVLLSLLVDFLPCIVCGACGNQWYLSHTKKAVAEVRRQGLAEADYLQSLSARGGTNIAACFAFFALVKIPTIARIVLRDRIFAGG